MLYYIESNVKIKVQGISGPWEKNIIWMVNAPSLEIAKNKYENRVKQDFAHMAAQSFHFEYTKIAGTID